MKKAVCSAALMGALLAAGAFWLRAGIQSAGPEFEMTTYYVGFLYRGAKWSPEVTPAVEQLQKDHMAHIGQMAKDGKLLLAGPFTDNTDLRGMFVFQTASIEEARALSEADPAVKAGRLRIELHPWLSPKGIRIDQGTRGK